MALVTILVTRLLNPYKALVIPIDLAEEVTWQSKKVSYWPIADIRCRLKRQSIAH